MSLPAAMSFIPIAIPPPLCTEERPDGPSVLLYIYYLHDPRLVLLPPSSTSSSQHSSAAAAAALDDGADEAGDEEFSEDSLSDDSADSGMWYAGPSLYVAYSVLPLYCPPHASTADLHDAIMSFADASWPIDDCLVQVYHGEQRLHLNQSFQQMAWYRSLLHANHSASAKRQAYLICLPSDPCACSHCQRLDDARAKRRVKLVRKHVEEYHAEVLLEEEEAMMEDEEEDEDDIDDDDGPDSAHNKNNKAAAKGTGRGRAKVDEDDSWMDSTGMEAKKEDGKKSAQNKKKKKQQKQAAAKQKKQRERELEKEKERERERLAERERQRQRELQEQRAAQQQQQAAAQAAAAALATATTVTANAATTAQRRAAAQGARALTPKEARRMATRAERVTTAATAVPQLPSPASVPAVPSPASSTATAPTSAQTKRERRQQKQLQQAKPPQQPQPATAATAKNSPAQVDPAVQPQRRGTQQPTPIQAIDEVDRFNAAPATQSSSAAAVQSFLSSSVTPSATSSPAPSHSMQPTQSPTVWPAPPAWSDRARVHQLRAPLHPTDSPLSMPLSPQSASSLVQSPDVNFSTASTDDDSGSLYSEDAPFSLFSSLVVPSTSPASAPSSLRRPSTSLLSTPALPSPSPAPSSSLFSPSFLPLCRPSCDLTPFVGPRGSLTADPRCIVHPPASNAPFWPTKPPLSHPFSSSRAPHSADVQDGAMPGTDEEDEDLRLLDSLDLTAEEGMPGSGALLSWDGGWPTEGSTFDGVLEVEQQRSDKWEGQFQSAPALPFWSASQMHGFGAPAHVGGRQRG